MAEPRILLYGLFFLLILIIFAALYIFMSLAIMSIAKKTSTKNSWLAWIPVANLYLITDIARLPIRWFILYLCFSFAAIMSYFIFILTKNFLWILPYLIFIICSISIAIYFWWRVCERLGRSGWLSLLMIVPIANFILIGILAWGNKSVVSQRTASTKTKKVIKRKK